jgi:hypothetical protein
MREPRADRPVGLNFAAAVDHANDRVRVQGRPALKRHEAYTATAFVARARAWGSPDRRRATTAPSSTLALTISGRTSRRWSFPRGCRSSCAKGVTRPI